MSARKPKEPELNRASLLAAASREFAERGFQGARLEVIASEANITRAMVYYYFGGREGLYLAALEEVYRHIRTSESALDLEGLTPVDAMRKLACFRIDYYVENPLIVALLAIENQHKAEYLKNSKEISARAGISLEPLGAILQQGQAQGIFRPGIDVVELHQIMVSMGMFNVSNQHTFGLIFKDNTGAQQAMAARRNNITEMVVRFVLA